MTVMLLSQLFGDREHRRVEKGDEDEVKCQSQEACGAIEATSVATPKENSPQKESFDALESGKWETSTSLGFAGQVPMYLNHGRCLGENMDSRCRLHLRGSLSCRDHLGTGTP